jgi:hypothetical protein
VAADAPGDLSTMPHGGGEAGARRRRHLRRAFFAALTAVLLLGALGFLGPRTGEVSAQGAGVELTVGYPTVNRPGLAAKVSFEVRRAAGADTPVTLAVTSSYFDALAEVTVDPEPVRSTADADRTIWRFEPSPGAETLVVTVQGRIHPSGRVGRPAATAAVLENGEPVVSVRFSTVVVP